MKIAIASDHAGFDLKRTIAPFVVRLGHEVFDLGACDTQPSDYPDFAAAVGQSIMASTAERGIGVAVARPSPASILSRSAGRTVSPAAAARAAATAF